MKLRTLLTFSVRASLLVANLMSVSAVAESSVWKVSKGDDYLYVGGTAHLLPPSEFPLPAEFEFAYQQADTLILETAIPDATDMQAQQAMLSAFQYQDGTTLEQVLSAELYQQLGAHFAGFGIPIEQLKGFRPGFIMTQLTVLAAMQAQMAGTGVDHYFANRAIQDGKATAYLESLDFQLQMIANLGEGYEDRFIRMNLEQINHFEEMFKQILEAWRAGDLTQLDELVIKPTQALDLRVYQAMFVNRNQNWLPLIEDMFKNQQRELVLVGAGHLAGEHSVLALLSAAGYRIEQVSLNKDTPDANQITE